MTLHLGYVAAGSTLYIPFSSYSSAGASASTTGLAVTDIEIYKNGSTTQRASDAGYATLDTDGLDFDGLTGINGFSIDLSDNTDTGFFASGSFYWVVVSSVTVDSQTVNFVAATFWIGPGPADVLTIEGSDATDQIPTAAAIRAEMDSNSTQLAAIVEDTGTTLPGYLDTEIAAILEDTGTTIPGLIAALNNLSAADVNAEVVDALATDTYAEPTGAPGATVALATKIGFIYMALRNKLTVTASAKTFYDDGGSAEWSKALSDDGTTFTEAEGA